MTILAIDLGTTNSACAIWRDGEAVSIPNRLGDLLTPSVVGVDERGEILVGRAAKERLITHPSQTVAVFKRLMGTSHRVQVARQEFTAVELSSLVIKSLKEDAEAFLGYPVEQAIVSVPAYFNDNQRFATKKAGELAGLKVDRLVNEPTAAAMAYGLHEKKEGTFIIVDLGGGTLDVTVLEFFEGVMQVHSSSGDNFLGGEDFVDAMVEAALSRAECRKSELSAVELHQLQMKMETVKRRISGPAQKVSYLAAGKPQEITVDTEWFTKVVTPLLVRLQRPIENALRDAGIPAREIDEVVLVGGSTKLAAVRSSVGKLFRRLPACSIDPDFAVVRGGAVQAGLADKDAALDDLVLTDVCPFTLGIDSVGMADGQFFPVYSPIIERNATVPVSRVERFSTVEDGQAEIRVRVFQGENRQTSKNVFLGSLNIPVPRNKAMKEAIDVRFSYDMNGILDVDVTVISNGKKYNKVIKNSPACLTEEDIKKSLDRLCKLKFHPRDAEINRSLLAKGERLYESSLGEERDMISQLMTQFEAVLDRQNDIEIAKARKAFQEKLEQFDMEEWL
ncbi:molecular chaperone HscC [Microbulbifer hydrolyticus]|uniref:Hsp70 family protein n=1 Tax=Microbulbifer hydrolyticus TaxID=48074 RepID=A0A6P1T8W1_9GAMM|nr:molecular chaperone HscC [Microbulbifer hydrolyticus]MBB5211225.1 molecular chaperone HscC [Microbulbifer hydrolyticus]QHQ38006.1 Hsp70 family protein [Microbulbifer hydrolyticus]